MLRVGDPHVKISNLNESEALMAFVSNVAKFEQVDRIEILGDLFHTHAVIRLEVQEFWTEWLRVLSDICQTVVLVGNHDLSGDYKSRGSALKVFSLMNKPNLIIVDKPVKLGTIGYLPYIHDIKEFIASAEVLGQEGAKVLVCHQTIQGSRYESGFYASDGVPTGKWSELFSAIISGHIHAEQEFENIIYPGTARWDAITDANRRKGIWLFEHANDDGHITSRTFITTENVCSPLKSITYIEGEKEPVIPENARVSLELVGSSDWVSKEKQKFKGKASIKTKITDIKKLENRKTGSNLEDFLKNVYVSTLDKESLLILAKEYGIV